MKQICASCGSAYERDSRRAGQCEECRPPDTRPAKITRQAQGYDAAWTRLSARARKLQPFCTDCGTVDDLTCDHSPEAWRRRERGLPIRLADVAVVCRRCNSARGAARGERVAWHGGSGRPDSTPLVDPFFDEECDGKCEGLCPVHRK